MHLTPVPVPKRNLATTSVMQDTFSVSQSHDPRAGAVSQCPAFNSSCTAAADSTAVGSNCKSHNGFPRYLDLPAELRNSILKYTFSSIECVQTTVIKQKAKWRPFLGFGDHVDNRSRIRIKLSQEVQNSLVSKTYFTEALSVLLEQREVSVNLEHCAVDEVVDVLGYDGLHSLLRCALSKSLDHATHLSFLVPFTSVQDGRRVVARDLNLFATRLPCLQSLKITINSGVAEVKRAPCGTRYVTNGLSHSESPFPLLASTTSQETPGHEVRLWKYTELANTPFGSHRDVELDKLYRGMASLLVESVERQQVLVEVMEVVRVVERIARHMKGSRAKRISCRVGGFVHVRNWIGAYTRGWIDYKVQVAQYWE